MGSHKIQDVKVIFTEPDNVRLVIVKVETNDPKLYGVGCATFTQRPTAVATAINDYLRPYYRVSTVLPRVYLDRARTFADAVYDLQKVTNTHKYTFKVFYYTFYLYLYVF